MFVHVFFLNYITVLYRISRRDIICLNLINYSNTHTPSVLQIIGALCSRRAPLRNSQNKIISEKIRL